MLVAVESQTIGLDYTGAFSVTCGCVKPVRVYICQKLRGFSMIVSIALSVFFVVLVYALVTTVANREDIQCKHSHKPYHRCHECSKEYLWGLVVMVVLTLSILSCAIIAWVVWVNG